MVDQLQEAADLLLGHPPSPTQKYVLLGLGLVIVYLIFDRMSRNLDKRESDPAKALLIVVLGGAVMLFSMVLAEQYVVPHLDARLHMAAIFLSPVVGSLVVTIPLMCVLQKANYLSASISWFSSVLVTGLILVLVRVGAEVVTTGKVNFRSTKERTQAVQKFLDQQ